MQGLNFIAGLMLLVVHDEEKVFWLMDTLLNKILPGMNHLTHTLPHDNLETEQDSKNCQNRGRFLQSYCSNKKHIFSRDDGVSLDYYTTHVLVVNINEVLTSMSSHSVSRPEVVGGDRTWV